MRYEAASDINMLLSQVYFAVASADNNLRLLRMWEFKITVISEYFNFLVYSSINIDDADNILSAVVLGILYDKKLAMNITT